MRLEIGKYHDATGQMIREIIFREVPVSVSYDMYP